MSLFNWGTLDLDVFHVMNWSVVVKMRSWGPAGSRSLPAPMTRFTDSLMKKQCYTIGTIAQNKLIIDYTSSP